MATMMECGHAANAMQHGQPVCAICYGLKPGATVPAETDPKLAGRRSKCSYAHGDPSRHPSAAASAAHTTGVPSRTSLPFFEYRPDEEFDQHYCGCWGWD